MILRLSRQHYHNFLQSKCHLFGEGSIELSQEPSTRGKVTRDKGMKNEFKKIPS